MTAVADYLNGTIPREITAWRQWMQGSMSFYLHQDFLTYRQRLRGVLSIPHEKEPTHDELRHFVLEVIGPMRVLFTGARSFTDTAAVDLMLDRLAHKAGGAQHVTVVHGGARGLDRIVGARAAKRGMIVEEHPADWNTHGKAAGAIRNQHMVDLRADLVVAYPLPSGTGTQDCIRRAVHANIKTLVYDSASGTYAYHPRGT